MVYQGSFQDILFVLAGLAWIAYSAYRSSKKKERSSSAPSTAKTNQKSSLFEELLEQYTQGADEPPVEDFNFDKVAEVATKPRQTESSIEMVESFTEDDIYEVAESKHELEAESALNETQIQSRANGAYNIKKQLVNKTFNLKKAFIYAEILNRKYS